MAIYLGNTLLTSSSSGGGGGGSSSGGLLTGTSTYRALLIGGGGNGFQGVTYGAGGSGAGAFFDAILSFYNDTTYNVAVGAGGGTTSFETAVGKVQAPTGGQGRRVSNGIDGASGGGGNSSNTSLQLGGNPYLYNGKGEQLVPINNGARYHSNTNYDQYLRDWVKTPGLQTLGFPGGWVAGGYKSGGGGGAGGAGQSNVSNGAGGVGRTSDIITTTTATSASVGEVSGGEVWFGAGGYGGRLSSINTTRIGKGPGTGGGGQGSSVASGVSSGDSGCVILKVPTSTNFTQTGANTYTDQGMTAIIWTGAGTFQLNS